MHFFGTILFSFLFLTSIESFIRTPLKTNLWKDIREPLKPPEKTFPITGFYGLIGPNIDYKNIKSLYDLFIGDGIVQGVFLKNGTATFVKSSIKTEKIRMEKTYGKMPKHIFMTILTTALYHMKMLPNMLGVANTAFMTVKQKIYALFERDMPYELSIDFKKETIETVKRQIIPFLYTFSGHSKYIDGKIETIEYQILRNRVIWYQMDEQFKKLKEFVIPMRYLPMIHDFYSHKDYLIVIDSPLKFDWMQMMTKEIPIEFDGDAPTYVNLIHKETGFIQRFKIDESFYLFHYSSVEITEDCIVISAPFYDTMNYNTIYHSGKYRKLYIDRKIGVGHFIQYNTLENLNLDFPISFTNYNREPRIILRNIDKNRINGFYVLDNLEIVKKIIFDDRFICGEPAIAYLDNGEPILMCLAFNDKSKQQFFMTIHLDTDEIIEYFIENPLLVGFHAMFMEEEKEDDE